MKRMLLALGLCIFFSLSLPVFAHSGGTDSDGGHHDGSDYHYHHGYPAHDHWDMDNDGDLDCPYLFDDNTGGKNDNNVNVSNRPSNSTQADTSSKHILTIVIAPLLLIILAFVIESYLNRDSSHNISVALADCWIISVSIVILSQFESGPGFNNSMLARVDIYDIITTLLNGVCCFFGVGALSMVLSALLSCTLLPKRIIDKFQRHIIICITIFIVIAHVAKVLGVLEFVNIFA